MNQVRTRGRWRAKTSVLRYAKTNAPLAAAARVPDHITMRGKELLRRLGRRPAKAQD